ncbi:hypothetical protein LTR56_016107 [Elasticomyces elasticus]|nr:hypothetical protein LTR56_016107 [Elasticomyces elasticus]KAK3653840.1 hypothetical protein LTR22_011055 [Elasticomyces elasticus]KAK4916042.1 hypothetical protein LTR49_015953 [Elasticomyces elasticus]KAK5755424.1 hypothetical protein LTS12_014531 [Elasticomyces elasticus]
MKFVPAILTLAANVPTVIFAESNTTAFNSITSTTALYDTTTDWKFSSNTTARTLITQPECSTCGYGVSEKLAAQAILAFCAAYGGTTIHEHTEGTLCI